MSIGCDSGAFVADDLVEEAVYLAARTFSPSSVSE
jgi:hypothetical protein